MIALVNMPFAPAVRPSIQIGILRALLDEAAIPATEFHAAVDFFDLLRQRGWTSQYTADSPSQVSEWYFSERPFDARPFGPDFEAVSRLQRFARSCEFSYAEMLAIRQELVPPFVERTAQAIAADPATRIAAFTVSYAQLNPSFTLARRVKELRPDVLTIFGGAGSQVFDAACREYMRVFTQIDAMLVGEAELGLIPLVKSLLGGKPPTDVPGVHYRNNGEIVSNAAPSRELSLDEAAIPRFEGWFAHRETMSKETRAWLKPVVLMELGRGCTWGDEKTCKFCAFTFHGRYRGKTKARVLEETVLQAKRYGTKSFYLVDDIVTNAQITDILPAMREAVPRLTIPFMEMRTATTKRHVQVMADAGVLLVQPGIENLDDGLLKRISKGTTTFHNVQFLKWARASKVLVSHNLILDVPGSTADELQNQLHAVKLLTHLDPPHCLSLQLVRFSPYHEEGFGQADGSRIPFKNLRADPFYKWQYPPGIDIEQVAYEFVYDRDDEHLEPLHQATRTAVREWQDRWRRMPLPFLVYEPEGDGLLILDGRTLAPKVHRFGPLAARAHATMLDCPMSVESAVRALGGDVDPVEVEAILEDFTAKGLALKLRGRFLALSLEAAVMRKVQPGIPSMQRA